MPIFTRRRALLAAACAALSCAGAPKEGDAGRADAALPDQPFVRRTLPAEVLSRKAIAYSGYRTGQSPEIQAFPSQAEITEDLRLLVRGGWGFIRLFDAGPHAEGVLEAIKKERLDLKVLLGVWLSGAKARYDRQNRDQMDRAVALAGAHPETVVAISVGNETLPDWSNVRVAPDELAAYITEVRGRVTVPVSTDDSWFPFTFGQDGATSYAEVVRVARAVDFLSVHVYAFADAFYESWDWRQASVPDGQRARAMMDAAIAYTKASVRQVRAALAAHDLDLPIVIGEIGWKDTTLFSAKDKPEDAIEIHFAHPVNQKMFFDDLVSWVHGAGKDADTPAAAFYFEAFDEPWKGAWGDDNWGLFDVHRRPKYVLWDAFPDLKPSGAREPAPSEAVHYRP
jgi:exo-beta-1,3-glucanase (GH17 family)